MIHVLIVPALIVGLLTAHLALLVRHKHTQFAGRGRTDRNVVGSKLWPTFTAKTLGLFFFVFAVCAALGGLAQINPVWLYGPFQSSAVSAGLAARLVHRLARGRAAADAAVGGRASAGSRSRTRSSRGSSCPGITFMLLYAWPWIEAWFTKDYRGAPSARPPARPARAFRARRRGARLLRRAVLRRRQRRDRRALRPLGELGDLRVPGAAVRAAGRVGLRHLPALQGARPARDRSDRSSSPSLVARTAEGGYVDEAEELSPSP